MAMRQTLPQNVCVVCLLVCTVERGGDKVPLFLVRDYVYPAHVDSVIIVLCVNGTRDLLTN